MNNYLNNQPPEYSRFINNQVLTETQLNAVLNHLNYQDKRTRSSLVGVGIVCGLNVEWSKGSEIVRLKKGVAVTTDGDLLHLNSTEYKGIRPFEDENARYPFFTKEDEEQITMWELTENDEGGDIQPFKKFSERSEILIDQAVALLYLEYYYREPEDCSPVDCDTGGEEVIVRPRVLIVSDEDAKVIRDKDSILSGTTGSRSESMASKFPPIFPKKAIHNLENSDEQYSLEQFYEQYEVYFDEIIVRIKEMNTIPIFKGVISDHNISYYSERLKNIGNERHHPQYLYDFYRDLAEIHNRISRLLQKRLSICAPDPEAFPKHLMLGRLNDNGAMRHAFYPSPALNHPMDLERIKQEFSCMLLMIREFDKTEKKEVRITPSASQDKSLTECAVPFYYNLERSEESKELLQNWDRKGDGPIPNYYETDYPEKFNPLRVSLMDHSFYRVEGVNGLQVTTAQENLQDLKHKYGLAFKVLPVAIGGEADEETIDYDAYQFYFEDLQAVLQAWNEENECMLEGASEFMSEFSSEEPGHHKSVEKEIIKERERVDPRYSKEKKESYTGRTKKTRSGVRKKKNAAMIGLSPIEGAIGKELVENIDASYSANDIRAQAREWFDFSEIEVDKQMLDLFVYEPVGLIAVIKETEDFKITHISDFTEENLERYVEALQKQCDRFKKARIQLQRYLSDTGKALSTEAWIDKYVQILNSVSESCCLARKIRVLYEQVLDRKKELLDRFSFETFIHKHPGAEHLAGVPKGGTLVLVYNSADGNTKLNHGRVVGDLCLPYICCSDTPSTTFVFPEQKVTLLLPTDHICIGNSEEDPVRLEVSPADAEVKAFIGDEELEDVIQIKENGIYFDPNGILKDNFEKPVRFTVNDQIMEPTIKLFEKPIPKFSMVDEIRFVKENKAAFVTFVNQTPGRSSLDFIWHFGNEESSDSGDKHVEAHYFVEPGQNFEAEVTLKAKGKYCDATFKKTITFEVPEFERDEEEKECRTYAEEQIKRSREVVKSMDFSVRGRAGRFREEAQTLTRVYDKVLDDLDSVLEGGMDQNDIKAIGLSQNRIQKQILSEENVSPQDMKVGLNLYYEIVLLYFYVHSCRESTIGKLRQAARTPDWSATTTRLLREEKELLIQFLKSTETVDNFNDVNQRFSERYGEDLQPIMRNILSIFHKYGTDS